MKVTECVDQEFCAGIWKDFLDQQAGIETEDLPATWCEFRGWLAEEHIAEQTIGSLLLREIRCMSELIVHSPLMETSCIGVNWRNLRKRQVVSRFKKLLKCAEGKSVLHLMVTMEGNSTVVVFVV